MKVFRRFKTVVIVASAALLVALPGPALGATQVGGRVTPNSRLTSDKAVLRGHDTPGIAVDPNNPNHVVLIEEDYLAGQCDYHTSFDGGHTWTDGVLTVPSDFANPPCRTYDSGGYAHFNQSVVFGSGQNVYTVFASHRGAQERPEIKVVQGEGDSIIMNHSSDGGKTWSTGVVAIQGGPGPQPYVIRPGIAVVPSANGDKLYVTAWSVFVTSGGASSGGGDRQLITSASTDGGKTWSAPVFASAPGEHIREDSPPVAGPDGSIYVSYRNRDDPATAPHPIVVAKSTDGGQTWQETSVAQVIPTPTGASGSSGYPRLAIDPKSNTVYVTYRNFNSSNVLSVYVSHSTDQNKTWSTPVQVNDDTVNAPHIGNEISVAPNGRVDVAWLDYRNAYPTATQLKATSEGNIYYASSSDGGNTFTASRRITDRSINLDDGLNGRNGSFTWWTPVMASMGNNSLLFAWSDSRLGNVDNDNNDIELATLELNSSAPPEVSSLPTTNLSNESVAASQLAYPAGEERIGSSAMSKLVIAPENDPASAMAGAVLARDNFGPLLLSPASGLTKDLKDEISRFRPSAIYLVGSTVTLSSKVETQLAAIGFKSVTRIQQPTAAAMAAAVANAMDARSAMDMTQGVASMPAAVVVNPAAPDAAAGVGLAAAMRYPLLYTDANSLPVDTATELQLLAIPKVYVVGSTSSVSVSIQSLLPGAVRITGATVEATSEAVASTEAQLDVPFNVAYVADTGRPADAALAASTAARVGALVVLTPHADAGQAQTALNSLHLGALDEVIQVHSNAAGKANVGVIVLFIVLGAVGLLLLLWSVAMRRRSREPRAVEPMAEPVAV